MEDVSVRAITIGVGVLIAIATITAVLTYYNTAKDAVRQIGSGVDIAGLYDKSIQDILLKNNLTGTDVINLLNYSQGRNDLKVSFLGKGFDNSYNASTGKPNTVNVSSSTDINSCIKKIIPNGKYKISSRVTVSGITNVTIEDR